jgi:hypothetical protein
MINVVRQNMIEGKLREKMLVVEDDEGNLVDKGTGEIIRPIVRGLDIAREKNKGHSRNS